MPKVYLACGSQSIFYDGVLSNLKLAGFDVYDRKSEKPFEWSEVLDEERGLPLVSAFQKALKQPKVFQAAQSDWNAMGSSSCCVLVLPCTANEDMEAGYFLGRKRPVFLYVPQGFLKPAVMYKQVARICTTMEQVITYCRTVHD